MEKKKIVLHFEQGLEEKYKRWTKEAVEEFLSLFPEHKDKFEIFGKTADSQGENCSKEFFERLIAQIKRDAPQAEEAFRRAYKQNPDGSYYSSVKDCLEQSRMPNGVDLSMFNLLRANRQDNGNFEAVIFKAIGRQENGNVAYGIGGNRAMYASTNHIGENEQHFKDTIIHEFGHIFNATFENRQGQNKVVDNLGDHCTDKCCQMYEYAYTDQYRRGNYRLRGENPFCEDCLREMKRAMNAYFPENVATNVSEGAFAEDDLKNANQKFKKSMRLHWHDVAKKEGSKYKEDLRAKNYKVDLIKADGSSTTIEASDENNIAMNAQDADGKAKTPDYKYFQDIAAYAKKRGAPVSFGDIKTPEFKALLLRACLEAEVKTVGEPKMDKEFKASIEKATLNKLEGLLAKDNSFNQLAKQRMVTQRK